MAFLKQVKDTWWAIFPKPGDRKKWIKIGKCSKTEAKKVLAKLEAELALGNFGVLEVKPIAFSAYAELYLSRMKAHKAPRSSERDKLSIEKSLIPFFQEKRLTSITAQDIEDYIRSRTGKVKCRTINIELLCLSHMLKKALLWNYLQRLPYTGKIGLLPERDKKVMRILSVDEVDKLKQAAGSWLYPFVMVALHTGMRLDEMLHLEWKQIDFDRRVIRLFNKPDFALKNLQPREIPIDDDLLEALRHHWEFFPRHSKLKYAEKSYKARQDHQRQWVFCHGNGQRLKAVYTSFINGCRRAGLENVSPHTLRHTFASHLIMAGVNLKAVQTLLGHKSIKITMDIYGHLTPDHLEASINRLPYRKEAPGKVVPLFAGQEIKREPGR